MHEEERLLMDTEREKGHSTLEAMVIAVSTKWALISNFKTFSIEQVPRSENKKADALSKITSISFAHLTKQVLVEILKKEIDRRERGTCHYGGRGYCWMTPLIEYLAKGTLPAEMKRARAIKIKAIQYTLISGVLYRKSFLEPWLRFIGLAQAEYVWIDAKPVTTITGSQVKKFVWDNIVCGFGLPGEIISDNGKQFRDNPFKDWCEKLNIKQRLGKGNKHWVKEVSHVLWAHRTMIKISNGDTPLSLTYDTKAVILVKIGMPSLRCVEVNQAENDEGLLLNLDILEERRDKAAVREARSKDKMKNYYNAKVRSKIFRPGDFVYHSNEASPCKKKKKAGTKWE
ncbi:reverse transcriptase domain-containing protein [Tanacetum coccineum]